MIFSLLSESSYIPGLHFSDFLDEVGWDALASFFNHETATLGLENSRVINI